MEEHLEGQSDGSGLPSRNERHKKAKSPSWFARRKQAAPSRKQAAKSKPPVTSEPLLKGDPPNSKGRKGKLATEQSEELPSEELAFYEALQSAREQASTALVAEIAPLPLAGGEAKRRRLTPQTTVLILGLSLLVNGVAGVLIYKLVGLYGTEKTQVAQLQKSSLAPPAPKPVATPAPQQPTIKYPIIWSDPQLEVLTKDERAKMEQRLSTVADFTLFPDGSFSMLFVPKLNQLMITHDGSVSWSAFVHNGYMRSYLPKKFRVTASLDGQVVFSGLIDQTNGKPTSDSAGQLPEWQPGQVYLVEMHVGSSAILDSKVLNALIQNPSEQAKLTYEVYVSYEAGNSVNPNVKDEVWAQMNTHTVLEPDALPAKK